MESPAIDPARPALPIPTHLFGALASMGAGAVHLGVIAAHLEDYPEMSAGFAAAGWAQILVGVYLLMRPGRVAAWATVATNAVAVGAWWLNRVELLPEFFTRGEDPHAVSLTDTAAVGLGLAAIIFAGLTVAAVAARFEIPARLPAIQTPVAVIAVISLATAAILTGADHDDGHGGHAHGSGDTEGEYAEPETSGHGGRTTLNGTQDIVADFWADPDWANGGVSGMGLDNHLPCTVAPTAEERAYADRFWQDVWAANERYRDIRVAVAEGFTPASPYDRPVVHYTRVDRLEDGRLLDANAPESLVYVFPLDGSVPVLVGVMFIGEGWEGRTESPGGCLIQWHIHYDLCMGTYRVAPAYAGPNGECPPGTTNEPSTPMVHVWMIDMPTGPYEHAGLPELDAALGGALLRPPPDEEPDLIFNW